MMFTLPVVYFFFIIACSLDVWRVAPLSRHGHMTSGTHWIQYMYVVCMYAYVQYEYSGEKRSASGLRPFHTYNYVQTHACISQALVHVRGSEPVLKVV